MSRPTRHPLPASPLFARTWNTLLQRLAQHLAFLEAIEADNRWEALAALRDHLAFAGETLVRLAEAD